MHEVRRNEFKDLLEMNELMFIEHTDFIKVDIPELGSCTYYTKKNRLNIHRGNKWESDGFYFVRNILKSKNGVPKHKRPSENWFNDYQTVEDYLIQQLDHDVYLNMDFSKCVSASDSTILIIKKLIS